MTKYAKLDASGRPVGFYSDDIHGPRTVQVVDMPAVVGKGGKLVTPATFKAVANTATLIPADAVQITDDQWSQLVQGAGTLGLVNGALVKLPAPVAKPTWSAIRAQRNQKLFRSDWTQGADSPLNSQAKQAWATYRQALRDLPKTFAQPGQVVWPTEPA